MALELFRREFEEAQSGPLMKKEADFYVPGTLIYEVRFSIANFQGKKDLVLA